MSNVIMILEYGLERLLNETRIDLHGGGAVAFFLGNEKLQAYNL
jgi:hypothetical protein